MSGGIEETLHCDIGDSVCMAHQCDIINNTRDQVMMYFIVDCVSYLKTSSVLKTFI